MEPRCRMWVHVLCCFAALACSEPSDDAVVLLNGSLVDSAGKPIRDQPVTIRLEGEKLLASFSTRSDSLGEFRMPVALDPDPLSYDRLVVTYHQRPCWPWATREATYNLAAEPRPRSVKLAVRLVATDKPAGKVAVGEMCGSAQQSNTDFEIGLAIDRITESDSVFGRFIINYSLSTSSDIGLFRGAWVGDHVALELTGNGAGSCQGVFQVQVRFLTEPNTTTARIVPPIPCVIREDSMRLLAEPFSLFAGF